MQEYSAKELAKNLLEMFEVRKELLNGLSPAELFLKTFAAVLDSIRIQNLKMIGFPTETDLTNALITMKGVATVVQRAGRYDPSDIGHSQDIKARIDREGDVLKIQGEGNSDKPLSPIAVISRAQLIITQPGFGRKITPPETAPPEPEKHAASYIASIANQLLSALYDEMEKSRSARR